MTSHYLLDPLDPLPKRWRDRLGPINVMAGPVKGWVMVRRPRCTPFCLRVSDLCNATRLPPHGPFEVVGVNTRAVNIEPMNYQKGS